MTEQLRSNPVLVVDREAVTKVAFVEAMADRGSGLATGFRRPFGEVDWAGDGQTARAMLRSKAYSLVLLNHKVPGIISGDFARHVRRMAPDARLILMDECDAGELRGLAARLGFDGYLCKPFTVRAVRDTLGSTEQPASAGVQKGSAPADPSSHSAALAASSSVGRAQPAASKTPAVLPASDAVRDTLDTLRADARARCVLLITTNGFPVDATGQTQGLNLPALGALIAANFAAAEELSRRLGNPGEFRASHHQGPDSHIYTYKASPELLLAVIFGAETRAGAVWLFAKRAAAALVSRPAIEPTPAADTPRAVAPAAEAELHTQMESQWSDLLDTEAES